MSDPITLPERRPPAPYEPRIIRYARQQFEAGYRLVIDEARGEARFERGRSSLAVSVRGARLIVEQLAAEFGPSIQHINKGRFAMPNTNTTTTPAETKPASSPAKTLHLERGKAYSRSFLSLATGLPAHIFHDGVRRGKLETRTAPRAGRHRKDIVADDALAAYLAARGVTVSWEPPADAPEAETPEAETPEAETPEAETPEVETPEAETPEAETPEVETPDGDVVPPVNRVEVTLSRAIRADDASLAEAVEAACAALEHFAAHYERAARRHRAHAMALRTALKS